MFRLSIFALCLLASQLRADTDSKTYNIPIDNHQKLVITAFKGSVEFIASGDSQNLRIKIERTGPMASNVSDEMRQGVWTPRVEKGEKAITVKFQEINSREFWEKKNAFDLIPEYKIYVTGVSVPVEVYGSKGVVVARDWKNSISVTLNTGSAEFNKIEGEVKAFVQSGAVQISDHKGALSVTSCDSKVVLKNIEGAAEIENFSGSTAIEKIQGPVRISSYNGKTKLQDVKGSLNFEMKIGSLDVEALDGSLRGDNGDGVVRAKFIGAPDVRVRSQAGLVNLRVPRKYSAHLNVGSIEGELRIPSHIKIQRGENLRFAVGRLMGGEREGQIFARSQSGSIIVNTTE